MRQPSRAPDPGSQKSLDTTVWKGFDFYAFFFVLYHISLFEPYSALYDSDSCSIAGSKLSQSEKVNSHFFFGTIRTRTAFQQGLNSILENF